MPNSDEIEKILFRDRPCARSRKHPIIYAGHRKIREECSYLLALDIVVALDNVRGQKDNFAAHGGGQ